MTWILALKICSSVTMQCQPPITFNEVFNTWQECQAHGLATGIDLNNNSSIEWINDNKILIQFTCTPQAEALT